MVKTKQVAGVAVPAGVIWLVSLGVEWLAESAAWAPEALVRFGGQHAIVAFLAVTAWKQAVKYLPGVQRIPLGGDPVVADYDG